MKPQVTIALVLVALSGAPAAARQQALNCPAPIHYVNRGQVDPRRLSVSAISGRVTAEVGQRAEKLDPVPACLGLFAEEDHRLVASTVADGAGRFKFGPVPAGDYRLVVRDPQNAFCVASIPLRIAGRRRGEGKSLVIHLRPSGIDDCSYGELK